MDIPLDTLHQIDQIRSSFFESIRDNLRYLLPPFLPLFPVDESPSPEQSFPKHLLHYVFYSEFRHHPTLVDSSLLFLRADLPFIFDSFPHLWWVVRDSDLLSLRPPPVLLPLFPSPLPLSLHLPNYGNVSRTLSGIPYLPRWLSNFVLTSCSLNVNLIRSPPLLSPSCLYLRLSGESSNT